MLSAVEDQVLQARRSQLEGLDTNPEVVDELLAFNAPRTHWTSLTWPVESPQGHEPHVPDWKRYAGQMEATSLGEVLPGVIRQLQFPVRREMSLDEDYRLALRGGRVEAGPQTRPLGAGRVELRRTAAGTLPLLWLDERADFEYVAQCLLHRNEPVQIPPSMGAALVAGYRNWERIDRLRAAFSQGRLEVTESRWMDYLKRIASEQPELISDRFVLVSTGAYSALRAQEVGLDEAQWGTLSNEIRVEHECGHYLTRRWLGFMSELPLDELSLDCAATVRVRGQAETDWVKKFLGVETERGARPGARLWNYRGSPPLSDPAFEVECSLVRSAIDHWETARALLASQAHPDPATALVLACAVSCLEEVAGPKGPEHLASLAAQFVEPDHP